MRGMLDQLRPLDTNVYCPLLQTGFLRNPKAPQPLADFHLPQVPGPQNRDVYTRHLREHTPPPGAEEVISDADDESSLEEGEIHE